jgi:serine/threonine protein kinase
MDSQDQKVSATARVEALLAEVLELDEGEQDRAIERLCAEHPPLAADLRGHFALYRRLLGEPAPVDGDRFGDYELLRPLGSGGMGTVWLARQRREGVDRTVALKMIRGGGLRSAEARERFRREARAAFRVEHPALCPVYDVGEVEGTPYLAMRYVPGCTLAELVAAARRSGRPLDLPGAPATATRASTGSRGPRTGGGPPLERLLELFETLALALHAAHEAGLIHRDVKPGNVMVTPAGEPVLLDFGLVRTDDEASDLTQSGQPLGTPAYMAPEQIRGHGGEVDRAADVYGLGATLYECLTLEPPFRAETREALYRAILDTPPRPARRSVRGLPKDLDAILETALRKEPRHRYRTALEFAEDLRALREHEPIHARAAGPLTRTALWMRRNPLASFVLFLLALALGFAIAQERAAARGARAARRAQQRAERSLVLARGSIDALVRAGGEGLREVPGAREAREDLLERALAYYRDLARELADDPSVLDDVARAHEAVAGIQLELGRVGEAREAVERAEQALESRARQAPSDAARAGLARVALRRAMVEQAAGRFAEAIESSGRALSAFEEPQAALDPATQLDHARARIIHAGLLHATGASAAARVQIERADEALARARAAGAPPADLDEQAARIATRRARIARDLEDFALAEAEFARAVGALEALSRAAPADRGLRYELATSLLARGRLRASQGRQAEALADVDAADRALRALVRAYPAVASYAGSLATAWNNRYTILVRLDRPDEAAAALREAHELLEKVEAATGIGHESSSDLATVTLNLGNLLRRSEGPVAALPLYERALAMSEELLRSRPDDLDLLSRAATSAESAALCLLVLGEPQRADPLLARARELVGARLARRPEDPRALRDLGRLRFNEGARAFEEGDLRGAAAILDEAAEFRQQLVDRNPSNLRLQLDLALTRARLATVLFDADPTRAAAVATAELARLDQLPPALRPQLETDAGLRGCVGSLALTAARGAGDPGEAARRLEVAWRALGDPDGRSRLSGWNRADALLVAVELAGRARRAADPGAATAHLAAAVALAEPIAADPPAGRDLRRALGERLGRLAALLEAGGASAAARSTVEAARAALLR